jgi:predicted solute-binding protein
MIHVFLYNVVGNDNYIDSDIIRAAPNFGTTNETETNANTVYQWSVNISVNVSDVSAEDITNINNWWALLALALVLGTAAGNILVCLAITWERRLQNVTNYFLMSLAITDLMVAVLVMPLGILTLVRGKT